MAEKKFITSDNLSYFSSLVKKGYADADTALSNTLTPKITAAQTKADQGVTDAANAKKAADNAATAAAGALAEAQKKIAKGGLKTINGQSLEGSGNIELDFTVAEVVTALPEVAKASKSKIYLVPSSASGTNNTYAEYIKITVDSSDKWEKIGEYQANIDLTPYAKAADLTAHTSNKSNPHAVTKAQVGLGNVDNTSDANKPVSTAQQTALDKKVDKVTGKQLSTNDYTTAEKTKLAGLDNYSLAKADGSDGGIDINLSKGSTVQNTVNIPVASYSILPSKSVDGLMSGDDKKRLDSISLQGMSQPGVGMVISNGIGSSVTIPFATSDMGDAGYGLMMGVDKNTLDTIASDYIKSTDFTELSDTDIETLWNNAK